MRADETSRDPTVPEDSVVWRYFSLPKFIDLLQSRGLFFSRADRLGDPLEGSSTQAEVDERTRQLYRKDFPQWSVRLFNSDLQHEGISDLAQYYVNCWHLGGHESMAMWRGYGEGKFGIALRSTFGRLDRHLPASHADLPARQIQLRRVSYIDYSLMQTPLPPTGDAFTRVMRKSRAYEHESEIRAVFLDVNARTARTAPPGYVVPIDFNQVVEAVVVSPLAPLWFVVQIRKLCEDYEDDVPVIQSGVFGPPAY